MRNISTLILLAMLIGCSHKQTVQVGDVSRPKTVVSFPWVWQEKGRVASPSGGCEVVTYEGDRGAMSSYAFVCFLVKPGEKVDPNTCDYYEPVLSSSHVLPKVRWESSSQLVINTQGGYVTHERPYSREFMVAIEFQNEPLSPQWSDMMPNKSLEPTAVGVVSSAVAVHAASRRWLSFFR